MKRSCCTWRIVVAGVLMFAGLPLASATEAAFPARPIRLIVPFVAGGGTDLLARLVAPRFGETLGHQLVIDNRGGAGSVIGTQLVATSAADGYTLGMFDTAFAVNASLIEKLPYDPERDFTFVALVATSPTMLVANPGLKVRTVQELIAAARKNPGKITAASAGVGSFSHLSAEMLKSAAKIDLLHVPFKGNGAAITDVIGGHTNVIFVQPGTVTQHVQAGALVALAITGKKPSPLLPNVPTFASAGLPTVSPESFRFVTAPRGLPAPIEKKLASAFGNAMVTPDLQGRLETNGFAPEFLTSVEARTYVINEIRKWRRVVSDSGAKASF